jgi:hypothetical protein
MNNLPVNAVLITDELVQANYNLELTRFNYQRTLQELENVKFTRENVNDDLLKPGKEILAFLEKKKDADKKPFTEANSKIQSVYNGFYKPIDEIIKRKANERGVIVKKMDAEKAEENRVREQAVAIQKAIIFFVNNMTTEITSAETDEQIVLLEKKIGSETTRTTFYGDFINDLKTRCEVLKPLIKDQKEYIRKLKLVEQQTADEMSKGNDFAAVKLREEAEGLKAVIDENKIRLQETAYSQANNLETIVPESMDTTPKGRKLPWKFRVDDINLLAKKMPLFVTLVVNEEAAKEYIKANKDAWDNASQSEVKLFGLTFFQEKSYK